MYARLKMFHTTMEGKFLSKGIYTEYIYIIYGFILSCTTLFVYKTFMWLRLYTFSSVQRKNKKDKRKRKTLPTQSAAAAGSRQNYDTDSKSSQRLDGSWWNPVYIYFRLRFRMWNDSLEMKSTALSCHTVSLNSRGLSTRVRRNGWPWLYSYVCIAAILTILSRKAKQNFSLSRGFSLRLLFRLCTSLKEIRTVRRWPS